MKYNKIIKLILCVGLTVGVLSAGTIYMIQRTKQGKSTFYATEEPTTEIGAGEVSSEEPITDSSPVMVKVFVCGAVVHPSLYEIVADARVYDAVQAAGGLTEDANPDYVNQAEHISDGQRIYIPRKGEKVEMSSSESTLIVDGKVNINQADLDTLMTLPGIGENKAKKILEYRNKMGRFTTKEEIMNVTGIGESIYQSIQDVICVDSG